MPLDALQDSIARTALALPQARTLALAEGGAMLAHGFVTRRTQDVDLFTELDEREATEIAEALRHALHGHGLRTRPTERGPHDHRFVVVDPSSHTECAVEIFPDGGRLHPRVALELGAVLHPDDLAADKVLALWGRGRPRDYFDVAALIDRFGRSRLLELAATKDRGFTLGTFVDALRAIGRLDDPDWLRDGITTDDAGRLRRLFTDWSHRIQQGGFH
jgi:hypothetical protein